MKKVFVTLGMVGAMLVGPVSAEENKLPKLDHVFLIMMENHAYGQIIGNSFAPFINNFAKTGNMAGNYFAVGHPSLTNYLEVVGGSNFGVLSDHFPAWHDASCTPNILSHITNFDTPPSSSYPAQSSVCPIAGTHGWDAATAATDAFNETPSAYAPGVFINNIDGVRSIPQATNIVGKTIADQLVEKGHSWKSYQESIPLPTTEDPTGVDGVNISDGLYSNLTDFTAITAADSSIDSSGIVAQYAVKHNPFAYFQSVQEGHKHGLSLKNVVGFDGAKGFYADLATGNVPNFSFIAPNQCHDQHGRGNAGAYCNYDPNSDGTQKGLNPALIQLGDNTVERLVTAIKASPAWKEGKNAIVLMWDENDYSVAPNTNQVALIVHTNYHSHGVHSKKFYNHFSLLKTLDTVFGLPCLNHACDADVHTMNDLFAGPDLDD